MAESSSRTTGFAIGILAAILFVAGAGAAEASVPSQIDESALRAAFADAQSIDLATSKVSSVVTLRDVVEIPPPSTPVLVKTFAREHIPEALKPAFSNPDIMGVTISGRYIAIIRTEFYKEYQDVLRHELVHAYISMASPQPLPFWFQEGSAVHFSMDKTRKFYGQPSKDQIGVMVGRTVELTDAYKQKLQSFHFLIEKVGKKRFYEWYRNAVETGVVDARPLVGLTPKVETKSGRFNRPFPVWLGVVIGIVVISIIVIGLYAARRESDE